MRNVVDSSEKRYGGNWTIDEVAAVQRQCQDRHVAHKHCISLLRRTEKVQPPKEDGSDRQRRVERYQQLDL